MRGFGQALLVGVVLGLVAVVVFVAATLMGVGRTAEHTSVAEGGPVLVALVLPDADGVNTVRVLDRYTIVGSSTTVTSVDPLTGATVSGTTARTLADTFTFGGGAGLAKAYAQTVGGTVPGWIVIEPAAWEQLTGSASVPVSVPADVEVFDGKQLYSYPKGATSVPAPEVRQLMSGAAYLTVEERRAIRGAVGTVLATAIGRHGLQPGFGFSTNLPAEELAVWLAAVKATTVRADNGQ